VFFMFVAGNFVPFQILMVPLRALMRCQNNVQEPTVRALLDETPEYLHHAAMMNPHTAAELDLSRIRAMVNNPAAAHGGWQPTWARNKRAA
jgi:alpha-galactosidase